MKSGSENPIKFNRKVKAQHQSKRAEAEQFYQNIFSSINAIIYVFDLNHYRMVWTNDGFNKILGYKISKKKVPRGELLDIHHPSDISFIDEMKDFFITNPQGTFTGIFQIKKMSGDYVWLCTSANLFRKNENEQIFEVVGVSINFNENICYDRHLKNIARKRLALNNHQTLEKLTKRERELIRYFASGVKTRAIAHQLGLSFHTVNNHRKNILKKLGLNNLASLVNFAVEHGLNA